MERDKSKAEKAHEFIQTIDGNRKYREAIFTSRQAIIELLGATELTNEEPKCPTCGQDWLQGSIKFKIKFDDNSVLNDKIFV